METYLCLDAGGSKYVVGLIRHDGTLVAKRGGKWDGLTEEGILHTLVTESRALMAETGERPDAVGVTIPGLADAERGLWVEASFSGIRDFAICARLQQELGIPAYCENDGQAYALAEMLFGCCQDAKDFLFMNISNGIGGAIVTGGQLVRGHTGCAGEFGHCCVVPGGRPCKCGLSGCLEMHAAGPGIARNYQELGGGEADCRLIAQRAREGEETALRVFELEGEYLSRVLGAAVNLLNPQRIVIGGGVSLAFDLFEKPLRAALKKTVYAGANPQVDVCATPLGYDAGLYSAAAIAVTQREHLCGY